MQADAHTNWPLGSYCFFITSVFSKIFHELPIFPVRSKANAAERMSRPLNSEATRVEKAERLASDPKVPHLTTKAYFIVLITRDMIDNAPGKTPSESLSAKKADK